MPGGRPLPQYSRSLATWRAWQDSTREIRHKRVMTASQASA